MSVLRLESIHRSYQRSREALKGVSLAAEAGEVIGLIGPNGAGKTTLLRIAVGVLKQHRGAVRVFEMDPWQHAIEVKRRLGYVAESQVVPAHLTVRDLIDLHRELYPSWDTKLERELSQRLDIDDASRISALSKGQARKALLMCAIAHRPELLVLDEPAGGLDPAARREFLEVSIELLNDAGSTIVFSSHHMADVERIAGRLVLLEAGEKLLDLDLDDFREGYCLAVLPKLSEKVAVELSSLAGFVRSRQRDGATYAVFSRPAGEVDAQLRDELGIDDARCARTSLEEMFVALVGGGS